jgi:hypothetical protein
MASYRVSRRPALPAIFWGGRKGARFQPDDSVTRPGGRVSLAGMKCRHLLVALLAMACTPLNETTADDFDASADVTATAVRPDAAPGTVIASRQDADLVGPGRPDATVATAAGPGDASRPAGTGGPAALDAGLAEHPLATGPFNCTRVIGNEQAAQWFEDPDFDHFLPGGNWELVSVAGGTVQDWADPRGPAWSRAATSTCVLSAPGPDRVLFIANLNQSLETASWVTLLTTVVENLRAHFPNLRRIELGTLLRAPQNLPCSAESRYTSAVDPRQDDADATMAATYPGLVRVTPKYELMSCDEFSSPPSLAVTAVSAISERIAAYYRALD